MSATYWTFVAWVLSSAVLTCASPSVVADHRIRNPNLTPKLGRGYSESTSEVVSTCLEFTAKSEATYNYDYSMLETTSNGSTTGSAAGHFEGSAGWGFAKVHIGAKMKEASEKNEYKHFITTRMASERYYSSVEDQTAFLTKDASDLIKRGDIVGFFQSCGSGYIRSIRRTAEVVAVFEFTSDSKHSVAELAASVNLKLWGYGSVKSGFDHTSSRLSESSSTTITIKAFGLGLSEDGASTLVARNLEDYDAAMKFAFKSMQNDEVGMIRGIEVVNWANNLQFQTAINFDRLPRINYNPSDKTFAASNTIVEAIEVKAITMINAEFLTLLESRYRAGMKNLMKLNACVGELVLMNLRQEWQQRFLVDHTRMDFSPGRDEDRVTVSQLIDVLNKDMLKLKFQEMTHFVQAFYAPCATHLLRTSNAGRMTQYWFSETLAPFCPAECLQPATVVKDDGNGTPVDPLECEFPKDLLALMTASPMTAMKGTVPDVLKGFSVETIVDKYCMPELSPETPPPVCTQP